MTDTINAVSRALSNDVQTLNAISHNVANSNTPGYRAERVVPSFATQVGQGAELAGSTVEKQQSLQGNAVAIDQKDGPLVQTHRALDLALRGNGFFCVQRGEQTLLVRAGSFRINQDGIVVNANGDQLLGESGPISLEKEGVRIDAKGQIWDGTNSLGQIKLFNAAEPAHLQPVDGGFRYDGQEGEWAGSVQQGALEQANVDVAAESIRLMELTRHVESVQRAISIYDQAMDTGINRLGDN
jgi:flagellar basal-body rod protein FlgG